MRFSVGLNAKAIGRNILRSRLAKGMTQAELAKALNVDRGTVGRWETGHTIPRHVSVPKVAALLGQTPEALLAGSEVVDGAGENVRQNESVLRAEKATLKQIRQQVERLANASENNRRAPLAVVNSPATVLADELVPDRMLADIIAGWDAAKPAARLVAAYLVTQNWSYQLKLWNQEVSVDEDILKTLRKVR